MTSIKRNLTIPPVEKNLDLEVLRLFRLIFKSVRKHFQSIEDELDISGSSLWAIAVISDQHGISITELARAMSVHQSTASNIIAKLVDQNLVRKERKQDDNRIVGLFITELGQSKLHQAPGPVRGLLPDALGKMPYRALCDLQQNLQILLEQMDLLEMQGGGIPLADM